MSNGYGWSGQILRINLSNRESSAEDVRRYSGSFLGGRGVNTKIIYDEVGPEISPFDPANRLCLGSGVLSGTLAPSTSRMTIDAVSPNGLLGTSGIGGFIAAEIRYAGYGNIIIEGKSDKPVYLYIHDDAVEFEDATPIWGMDTWETQRTIRKEIRDSNAQVMCIGSGGENLVSFSSIVTGMGSAAGRMGLGAIMGSKNVKAIAVRGTRGIKIAKREEFIEACLKAHNYFREKVPREALNLRSATAWGKDDFARYIDAGKLVVGNWEDANCLEAGFKSLDSAEAEEFWNRYALYQTGCFGCPLRRESVFDIPDVGIAVTKCVNWFSSGSTIWNNDRKLMVHVNYLCQRYGLDSVSTGNCISFLMELYHRGIITEQDTDGIPMRRGDRDAIISTIHKIGNQEGFGRLFREGVLKAARTIGKGAEEYAMAVKGLELYPLELRAYKAVALVTAVGRTYDLSATDFKWKERKESMEKWAIDRYGRKDAAFPTTYEDKALSVWDFQNRHVAGDILGVCKYVIPWGPTPSMEIPAKLLSLATGIDTSEDDLLTVAQRTWTVERAFNVMRGIRKKDDTLPKRLFEEPVSDGSLKGEVVDEEQFDKMLQEYYTLRGCDEDGVPTEETFSRFGLSSEWKVFEKTLGKEDISHG